MGCPSLDQGRVVGAATQARLGLPRSFVRDSSVPRPCCLPLSGCVSVPNHALNLIASETTTTLLAKSRVHGSECVMLPGPRCKASRSQASSQREACHSAQRADISNPISRVTHTPGAEMPAANDKASAPIGVCCLPPVRARRSARSKHPAPKHPDGLPAGSPDQMPCAAVGRTPGAEMPANDKTSTPIIRGVRCPSLPRMHIEVRAANTQRQNAQTGCPPLLRCHVQP